MQPLQTPPLPRDICYSAIRVLTPVACSSSLHSSRSQDIQEVSVSCTSHSFHNTENLSYYGQESGTIVGASLRHGDNSYIGAFITEYDANAVESFPVTGK